MAGPYHWTDTPGEIARLGALADAVELSGCADLGDAVERCDGAAGADLWSVYYHFPAPPDDAPPDALRGALCIADRDTPADARAFADELAKRFNIPVHDFS